MKLPLWTLIPAMFLLTLIYFGLGYNGYWRYTIYDFIFGNLLVIGIIGLCYGGEYIYKIKHKYTYNGN